MTSGPEVAQRKSGSWPTSQRCKMPPPPQPKIMSITIMAVFFLMRLNVSGPVWLLLGRRENLRREVQSRPSSPIKPVTRCLTSGRIAQSRVDRWAQAVFSRFPLWQDIIIIRLFTVIHLSDILRVCLEHLLGPFDKVTTCEMKMHKMVLALFSCSSSWRIY